MAAYRSKYKEFPGTSIEEVLKLARKEYHRLQKRTPRRLPYVRSKYFTKDKVFVNLFWEHLRQKVWPDRLRRLKLYKCALDTIRHASETPKTQQDPNNSNTLLHRFAATTLTGEAFAVQIKENKKTGRKDFISVFPTKKASR